MSQVEFSQRRILAKALSTNFVIFLDHSTEKHEMKTVKLTDKQVSMPVQSWISRAERKHQPKVDCYSELMVWLRHAILKAEKNKNFNRKDKLLILLKDP